VGCSSSIFGRESISLVDDVKLFRERMHYNFLATSEAKQCFLADKAARRRLDIHHVHDIYAPLINRRVTFAEIAARLTALGYSRIDRTIDHTELWVRGVKGPDASVVRSLRPA